MICAAPLGHASYGSSYSNGGIFVKTTDNVVDFPRHLAGGERQTDGSRNVRLPVRQGMVDVYFGEDGMASLDACLPTTIVLRLLKNITTGWSSPD
jgi:hypothetical protein